MTISYSPPNNRHKAWPNQQGAALIMVLVVVSVVAITAVSISEQTQLSIYLTSNQRDRIQAGRYVDAAELRALLVLNELKESSDVNLSQNWAGLSTFEIDQGKIDTQITDLRTCVNLNILADQVEQRAGLGLDSNGAKRLKHLLALHSVADDQALKFVSQLKDWVDPDTEKSQPYGFEQTVDNTASGKQLTADAPLSGFEELLFIQTPEIVLQSYGNEYCILPIGAGDQININTLASPLVLSALSLGELDVSSAQTIINQRPNEGYKTLEAFKSGLTKEELRIINRIPLSVNSEFFRIQISVNYGNSTQKRTVYVKMDADLPKVIRRNNGHG